MPSPEEVSEVLKEIKSLVAEAKKCKLKLMKDQKLKKIDSRLSDIITKLDKMKYVEPIVNIDIDELRAAALQQK